MKQFNGLENYSDEASTVLVLGMFDGLHIGHLALIDKAFEIAGEDKITVLTFANHFKSMEKAFPLLLTKEEKIARFKELGIDELILQTIDRRFMDTEPCEFIGMLKEKINIKAIVVGFDYTFGRLGKGDVSMLKEHFDNVYVVDEVDVDGQKASSTRLRKAIENCDFDEYIKLCNRPYSVMGNVVYGNNIGSKHNTPTINVPIYKDKLLPRDGVYMTRVIICGRKFNAIANLGYAPTFDRENRVLEVHIFDFDENAYGSSVEVLFYKRIRDVIKFKSPGELYEQIGKDVCCTKKFFKALK